MEAVRGRTAGQEHGALGLEAAEGADLLADDAAAPQAETAGEERVGVEVAHELGGGEGPEVVGADDGAQAGRQITAELVDEGSGEVGEETDGEVGLDEALGPVEGAEALVDLAEGSEVPGSGLVGVDAGRASSQEATASALMRSSARRASRVGALPASLA